MLKGRKLIVAITGSIAAYKSPILVRELVKWGADVKVIMSPSSRDFVTPMTLATVSKHPVLHEFTDDPESGTWNNHVELGLWADALVIAPLSANTLAKMCTGVCDNLLMATFLSAKCPVFAAPAMDLDMFAHESTQENLNTLTERGVHIIEPTEGELASGLSGKGRMEEPELIAQVLVDHFNPGRPLEGRKALVTAGPTFESIDPVRFIGNHSSGKMGYAIAESLAEAGARVHLISGPSKLNTSHREVERIDVVSAAEMYEAVNERFDQVDICVMAAAVADYTPAAPSDQKLKKKEGDLSIELKRTKDILAEMGMARTFTIFRYCATDALMRSLFCASSATTRTPLRDPPAAGVVAPASGDEAVAFAGRFCCEADVALLRPAVLAVPLEMDRTMAGAAPGAISLEGSSLDKAPPPNILFRISASREALPCSTRYTNTPSAIGLDLSRRLIQEAALSNKSC